jgi:thiol-disulfide isomerase/thioredoxin
MAAAGLVLAAVAILGILKNRGVWTSPGAVVGTGQPSGNGESVPENKLNGKQAPDFELATLDGTNSRLFDMMGHPILINYWATWCPPCREELPLIQKRLDKYGPDLVVLAVNAGEDSETVKNYINENGFTFPVLLDPEWKVEALFGVMAYPTSVFIDREGIIQARYVGGLSDSILDEYLKLIGVNE